MSLITWKPSTVLTSIGHDFPSETPSIALIVRLSRMTCCAYGLITAMRCSHLVLPDATNCKRRNVFTSIVDSPVTHITWKEKALGRDLRSLHAAHGLAYQSAEEVNKLANEVGFCVVHKGRVFFLHRNIGRIIKNGIPRCTSVLDTSTTIRAATANAAVQQQEHIQPKRLRLSHYNSTSQEKTASKLGIPRILMWSISVNSASVCS